MYHLITIVCVVAAIACYTVGSAAAPWLFALGVVFEVMAWRRLINRRRASALKAAPMNQ